MSRLSLKLAPHEQVYVNGALLESGNKRTTLLVLSKASVLRMRDWIDDSQASVSEWHRLHVSWQRVVAGIEIPPQDFTTLLSEIRARLQLGGNEDPYHVLKMLKQKIADIS